MTNDRLINTRTEDNWIQLEKIDSGRPSKIKQTLSDNQAMFEYINYSNSFGKENRQ